MIPSVTSVNAKARGAGGINEIRIQCGLAAATVGSAVDRGDNQGPGAIADREHALLVNGMLIAPLRIGHAVAFLEIATGTERFVTTPRQDHAAHTFGVGIEAFEDFLLLETHFRVLGVRHFRDGP